jgi:TolB-like protein/DNA-binding winged helix-turn-helix (wHTH) protein/Tfp pilus assembly protein PilF
MSINDATAAHPHIRFGIFELDLRASELRKKGARVKLQEQPCQILAMLLERPGEIVSREELRNRLWQRDTFVDFDHSLNTAIMRLREVLGDSPENPIFIETLSRRGYRFIAPVEEVAPLNGPTQKLQRLHSDSHFVAHDAGPAPTGIPQDERAAGRAPHYLQISTRAITATALLIAAFALVSVLIFRYARKPSVSSANSEPIKSLVVLPLEDLSAEKNQDYFADGMTDELIASLAKIRQLRVISRTSAMAYKGTRKPLSEIARDLHVDAVVEGTVLRAGNRVRITAELVQVSTDRHLWAETYESELGNILTLQSQVASAIVNEIRINLTPEEQKRLATPRMVNAQAYEDYLKGRYYWNKRSEEGLTKAVEYYQRAADKDPQYALAYAGLADCYDLLGSTIIGAMPSADAAPNAKAAALKALAIDPSLVDAEITLASIKLNYDWDWQGAENGFKHTIELNPEQATAHQRYSLYLTAMGRSQESLAEIKRAHELDPLSLSINFSLAWRLYLARQYDQAIQQSRSTIDLDPNFVLAHLVLGQTYQQKGEFELAISELKKAASISPDSPLMLGALGHAYAVAGNAADAEKLREDLIRRSSQQYVSPFYVALIFTGLKENEKALDWLDKAYQDRSNPLIFLKVDPELDPLRSSPRFQDLQRRIGLPR